MSGKEFMHNIFPFFFGKIIFKAALPDIKSQLTVGGCKLPSTIVSAS